MNVSGTSATSASDPPALAELQRQVHALRVHQLRLLGSAALLLIVLGLVLRLFTSVVDGTAHRTTVLTAPFQIYTDPQGGPAAAVVGTGYLGLLLASLGVLAALWGGVVRQAASSGLLRLVRILTVLAIIGSVVACGFSGAAWISGTRGSSGGPGPFLLLGGVVLARWIFTRREWFDLWVDVPARERVSARAR